MRTLVEPSVLLLSFTCSLCYICYLNICRCTDGLGWPIAWPCLVDTTELHVNLTLVSICSLSTGMMMTGDVYY